MVNKAAHMAEVVDALDLKSSSDNRSASSILAVGTKGTDEVYIASVAEIGCDEQGKGRFHIVEERVETIDAARVAVASIILSKTIYKVPPEGILLEVSIRRVDDEDV